MKHASNISLLCVAVGVVLAAACSTALRERAPVGNHRMTEIQDSVDSLIDSMVKDRSTWVDPASPP